MLQAEGTEAPVKVEFDNFEHGFPEGFGPGGWGHLAYAIGIVFAVFQLYVAAFNYLPSQVVRGVHVGFLILMSFGLIGNFTARSNAGSGNAALMNPIIIKQAGGESRKTLTAVFLVSSEFGEW